MGKLLQKLVRLHIYGILLAALAATIMAEIDTDVPMGWAVVPTSVGREPISGVQVENTIGGGDGRVVTAKGGELAQYASSKEPLVIMAEGSFSGNIMVAPHKTIIGTGSGATLKGGFNLGTNVILRNFTISGGVDGIAVSKNNSIWIDHCDLSACSDGLLDITNGSDKVSVSWIKFSKHNKVMLINNGQEANKAMDENRNNVTLHHSSFVNTVQRHPRVGMGQVHILNNYYVGCSSYAIHVYWNAEVVIERNYFKGVKDAISDHSAGQSQGQWPGPGYVVLMDNYSDVSGSIKKVTTTDKNRTFNVDEFYMYDWVVTKDVQQVPNVVEQGAGPGAQWGKIGAIPTPGQGYTKVSTSPTLKWTKVGSESSSTLYFGKSNPPPEVGKVDGYSFQPEGKLDAGTVYYWKINDGKVWKFRTEGAPVSIKKLGSVKDVAVKKSVPAVKIDVTGKQSHTIGVQDGKNMNNLYLLNGKEIINGEKDPSNIKKEAVK